MPDTHYSALLHADVQAHAQRRQPLRLILIFLAVFFALQYAWEMSRDTWVGRTVIGHATVVPAAWLINALGAGPPVHADGYRIVSAQARLSIGNGCEGLETLFLLAAAFFSQPFPWKMRLWGIGLGILLVYRISARGPCSDTCFWLLRNTASRAWYAPTMRRVSPAGCFAPC